MISLYCPIADISHQSISKGSRLMIVVVVRIPVGSQHGMTLPTSQGVVLYCRRLQRAELATGISSPMAVRASQFHQVLRRFRKETKLAFSVSLRQPAGRA